MMEEGESVSQMVRRPPADMALKCELFVIVSRSHQSSESSLSINPPNKTSENPDEDEHVN